MSEYDRGRYEALRCLAGAWYGKDCYFDEPNGIIYSRLSHQYMTLDDALMEFMRELME